MSEHDYDAVVIGGGIVGCTVALYLKEHMERVIILEKELDFLQRASYANQARVHNGYHYPRSILTALRSRVNFPRFVADYEDCIHHDFEKYYAIGRHHSKTTARQFKTFCQRIGASLAPAPREIKQEFNRDLIEDVFLVKECAFDAVRLKAKLLAKITAKSIEFRVGCNVVKIGPIGNSTLGVFFRTDNESGCLSGRHVFNCTYSQMNQIHAASGLPIVPLKQELTEIALVQVPPHLRNIGITIVDGPFCSVMPFPPRGLHSLSHVRYTPHQSWLERNGGRHMDPYTYLRTASPASHYPHMIKDAQRYVPSLRDCSYVDSIWEVKSVLPSSEVDDGRPILFSRNHGERNLTCILGAKIDNIYDVLDEIEAVRRAGGLN